jgi:hypothetical protein
MPKTTRPDFLDRYLPAAGILAVVVFAGAIVFESNGPAPSDSPATVATKFASDQAGVLAGSYLLLVGFGFFAVFFAVLRSALLQAEGDPGTFSALTFGAGLVGVVSSTSYVAIYGALAHGVATAGGANLLFALFAISNSLDSVSGIFIGLAVLAAVVVILRTSVFPHWLGWLGLISGGLGALGAFALDRPDQPIGVVGFVGSILVLFWMVCISVVMLRRTISM